jgi:hypothetical protein
MLDPNLEKIRDHNMSSIQKGNLKRALYQAKDYLVNALTGHHYEDINWKAVNKEFKMFKKHIQEIAYGQG